MTNYTRSSLSDEALSQQLHANARGEVEKTAEVLADLAEFDFRRRYLHAGFASMWDYGLVQLPWSKGGLARRIHAARAARKFPALFVEIAAGRLHLTAVEQLAPHLTPENASELIREAANGSKHDIDLLLARRFPRPDVPTVIRPVELSCPSPAPPKAPTTNAPLHSLANTILTEAEQGVARVNMPAPTLPVASAPSAPPDYTRIRALSPGRHELSTTIRQETLDLLREAQDLLAHAMPARDVDSVLHRALLDLVARLKSRKFGVGAKPRKTRVRRKREASERYIPAPVKRKVFERDGGRCTFVGPDGHRCDATALLEYDHTPSIARGGITTEKDLRLRCHAHNQLEARRMFGDAFMDGKIERARAQREAAAP